MTEGVVVVALLEVDAGGEDIDGLGKLSAMAQSLLRHGKLQDGRADIGHHDDVVHTLGDNELVIVIGHILRNRLEAMIHTTEVLLLKIIDKVLVGDDAGHTIARGGKLTEGGIAEVEVDKHVGRVVGPHGDVDALVLGQHDGALP